MSNVRAAAKIAWKMPSDKHSKSNERVDKEIIQRILFAYSSSQWMRNVSYTENCFCLLIVSNERVDEESCIEQVPAEQLCVRINE